MSCWRGCTCASQSFIDYNFLWVVNKYIYVWWKASQQPIDNVSGVLPVGINTDVLMADG